jgi:CSLREA domain-containing protein
LLAPSLASAAVVAPNTTTDEYDAVPPPGSACSLREAIKSADGDSDFGGCTHAAAYGFDTVQVPAGLYKLTITGPPGADDSSGDLNTGSSMTIEAAPGAVVTIDGNGTDRVIDASVLGVTLTLDDLTIRNGLVGTPDPSTGVTGGGIVTSGGTGLVISNSTISGNQADGGGGGIAANGPTTLTNVTISGNTATESAGGGINGGGTSLALDHVTVTDNHSGNTGPANSLTAGGLYTQAASTTVHNSIIAGNTSASTDFHAPDCQGLGITSQDGNVIGDATGCNFISMPGDSLDTPALIGVLANNGGTTFTHALQLGSPAIDRGVSSCPAADQRGYPRPSGAGCDSGAYERFVCNGVALNVPGPFKGCVAPPPPGGGGTTSPVATPIATPVVNPVRKCRKKKHKRSASAAKKKCKKKKHQHRR